jgi:hypothetical protein
MKRVTLILLVLLLASSMVFATGTVFRGQHKDKIGCHFTGKVDLDVDYDDGTLIITKRGYQAATIEITQDYELYIDGRLIKTNAHEKELLGEFYELTLDLVDRAYDIGTEGAEIGIAGAKIGLQALGGLFKAMLSEYEIDDLEKDLELDAEILEERAEILEEQAEDLEDMADELEELAEELIDEIPELEELDW